MYTNQYILHQVDNDKFYYFPFSFGKEILCVHTLDTTWSVRLRHKLKKKEILVSHNKFHNVNAHFFYFTSSFIFYVLFFRFTCAFFLVEIKSTMDICHINLLSVSHKLWSYFISFHCFIIRKFFFFWWCGDFSCLHCCRIMFIGHSCSRFFDRQRFHELLISINQWIINDPIILYIFISFRSTNELLSEVLLQRNLSIHLKHEFL